MTLYDIVIPDGEGGTRILNSEPLTEREAEVVLSITAAARKVAVQNETETRNYSTGFTKD